MNGSRVLNPVAANEIAKHGVFLGAATHFMRFARAFVLRLERTESARMDVHWWRNEMTHQKPAGVSKTPVFKKPVLFLEETSDFLGSARILSISVPPPCPPNQGFEVVRSLRRVRKSLVGGGRGEAR